ncbi:MAG: hypothetical protein IJT00_01940, partial [Lachnospiraceae bacterium]|nr:hypothetical protein [Lachnospiraceae bacterium]
EFWLMDPCAYAVADSNVTPPKFEVTDSEESSKEVTVNIEESVETLSDDWYNTIKCSATVVYYLNGEIVGGEYKGFPEEDLYYRRMGEYPLNFDGEYDKYEIYGQYEESNYSEPMY